MSYLSRVTRGTRHQQMASGK